MGITIVPAIPCEPVIASYGEGHSYIKEFNVVPGNYCEMFLGIGGEDVYNEEFKPNYIDWNNHNAYQVCVAIGLVKQGDSIHEVMNPKCVDVICQCNAFLDACGANGAWAAEFSNLKHWMTEMITEAMSPDRANVIDLSSSDPQNLIDHVERLREFAVTAIVEHRITCCLQIA